jgi:prolyl oligopeptidase
MRRFASLVAVLALFGASSIPQPVAPVRPVTTDYFGTSIVDPYRWMEAGGPEFDNYLHQQNAYARSKLDSLDVRATLIASMKATVAAAGPAGSIEQVATAANRLFLTRRPAGGAYHALYVREAGRERVL